MRHLLILLIISITLIGYSQGESKMICGLYDEFDDTELLLTENEGYYEDYGDEVTEGFVLKVFLKRDEGIIIPHTIYVELNRKDELCVNHGNTLDVLFENGEKTTLRNWCEDNCDGENYFNIGKNEFLFKNSKVKGFRYTNQNDGNVIVVKENMDEKNKTYIMDLILEIDKINSGRIKLSICEIDKNDRIKNFK